MLAILLLSLSARSNHGEGGEIVIPANVKWREGPASLAKGAKMAVLEGDPSKKGPFVLRIKLPDGFRVMPHTYPKDEHVTVISGILYLGEGGKFDEKVGVEVVYSPRRPFNPLCVPSWWEKPAAWQCSSWGRGGKEKEGRRRVVPLSPRCDGDCAPPTRVSVTAVGVNTRKNVDKL